MIIKGSYSLPSRTEGAGRVTKFILQVSGSLLATFWDGTTKGSTEIKGLAHFIDVPPQRVKWFRFERDVGAARNVSTRWALADIRGLDRREGYLQ